MGDALCKGILRLAASQYAMCTYSKVSDRYDYQDPHDTIIKPQCQHLKKHYPADTHTHPPPLSSLSACFPPPSARNRPTQNADVHVPTMFLTSSTSLPTWLPRVLKIFFSTCETPDWETFRGFARPSTENASIASKLRLACGLRDKIG